MSYNEIQMNPVHAFSAMIDLLRMYCTIKVQISSAINRRPPTTFLEQKKPLDKGFLGVLGKHLMSGTLIRCTGVSRTHRLTVP